MMYSSYDTVECTEILKPRDKWSKEVVKYDTLNTNTMNALVCALSWKEFSRVY